MITIEGKNLAKQYGEGDSAVFAVKDMSLKTAPGEFLAIMGESGSGKSTLLSMLGALNTPTGGSYVVDGMDVYNLSPDQRADFRREFLGFVFQSFHLLPELDIVENVALPSMPRMSAKDAKGRAKELLKEVGLGERIGHRPQELSGGEQQRVAIARSLMNEPDIIFADEPTGNLDSKTGEKVLNYLFQLIEARRHTLVLVTHSKEVASRCSRELFLKDGLLV